jgi:thiosulfate/3-mercaptopyruvate sulfurtransferase
MAKGYVNAGLVWTPEQLHARLGDPGLRVLDVRVGEAFAMGHLPGARHFSIYALNVYDTDEAPLKSFVHMWAILLGQRGIAADDTVVVYGDISGMTAARGFWFLEYLGHRNVHLLDGGYDGWVRAGLPVTRDAERPKPAAYKYETKPAAVATRHDVLAAIDDPDKVILDTRSVEEWRGTDCRRTRCRHSSKPSASRRTRRSFHTATPDTARRMRMSRCACSATRGCGITSDPGRNGATGRSCP